MTAPRGNQSHGPKKDIPLMNANTPEQAIAFRANEDADYIKITIEEAAVQEAHVHGKLAIAHALTYEAPKQLWQLALTGWRISSSIDHHRGADEDLVERLAGKFVTPCLCLNASIMGQHPHALAEDTQVSGKLPLAWQSTLESSFNTFQWA
ncbi:Fc.00g096640.m01.CDS01 [Cosmosporella sp. VM-42]